MIKDQNTAEFKTSLEEAVKEVAERAEDEKLVFINAWHDGFNDQVAEEAITDFYLDRDHGTGSL